MEELSNFNKIIEIQNAIQALSEKLDSGGEYEGTSLERLTGFNAVKDIPTEHLTEVYKALRGEKRAMQELGETNYFNYISIGQKIGLYIAALLAMYRDSGAADILDNPCTYTSFKQILNCNISGVEQPEIKKAIALAEESIPTPKTKKKKRYTPRFVPPTLEELTAYIRERGGDIDPQYFLDYYTSANWKDREGKPVKNWKQRVISWQRNRNQQSGNNETVGKGQNLQPIGNSGDTDILANAVYTPRKNTG